VFPRRSIPPPAIDISARKPYNPEWDRTQSSFDACEWNPMPFDFLGVPRQAGSYPKED